MITERVWVRSFESNPTLGHLENFYEEKIADQKSIIKLQTDLIFQKNFIIIIISESSKRELFESVNCVLNVKKI